MSTLFSKPKVPTVTAPTVDETQAAAEEEAREEVERLKKGRVKTILTSGQGLASNATAQRKTVLGG